MSFVPKLELSDAIDYLENADSAVIHPYVLARNPVADGADKTLLILSHKAAPTVAHLSDAPFVARLTRGAAVWTDGYGMTHQIGHSSNPLPGAIQDAMRSPGGVLVMFIDLETKQPVCQSAICSDN